MNLFIENGVKKFRSEHYNYNFDLKTGYFERWGKDYDDDPSFSRYGNEILDCEVSTICHMGCKFCFLPNTKIATINGDIPIAKITIGDSVISAKTTYNKKYWITENIVEETYKTSYDGEIVVLELENGEIIKVTPEHPFYVKNKGWVEAGNLSWDDDIVSLNNDFKKCKNCKKLIIGGAIKRYYCSDECYEDSYSNRCVICGSQCYKRENAIFCKNCIDFGEDLSYHPLWGIYHSMLLRCYDKRRNNYEYYGGRGIKVNNRWHSFKNFIVDMGDRPEGHTLDRIDNDKNYGKDNCRWCSINEQRVNRGRFKNLKRKYKGVSKYGNKWKAEIRYNKKSHYLGLYETERDAAIAYNKKMKEFYPDNFLSYINNIEEQI